MRYLYLACAFHCPLCCYFSEARVLVSLSFLLCRFCGVCERASGRGISWCLLPFFSSPPLRPFSSFILPLHAEASLDSILLHYSIFQQLQRFRV